MGRATGLRAYGNKRDQAEASIVDALRAAGCLVYRLDKPCDLIVCHRNIVRLVEVKSGKRGKLTEAQEAFRSIWPLTILRTVDDLSAALKSWSMKEAA